MRTNIEIDDQLVSRVMRSSGARTKKAVVEAGLRLPSLKATSVDAEISNRFGLRHTGREIRSASDDFRGYFW